MKQILIALLATAALLSAHADETITMTGGSAGRAIVSTTATNRVSISPPARLVSIANAGSTVVYVGVRITSAEFATMLASTNAIPIPASASFEFVGGDPIDSIVIASASGTNTVNIGVQK